MKKKIFIISIVMAVLIASCAPAQTAEEVSEPAVMEEDMESSEAPAEEMEAEEEEVGTEEEAAPAEESDSSEMAAEVSFSADVWPIIQEYALDAHGGKGGVFLENYDDISAQVVPGDPENSMLYKVLIGDGAPQMPPGNPLPEELIQTIYDWIDQGAKNN